MRGTGTSRAAVRACAHRGEVRVPIGNRPSSIIHPRAFTLIELLVVISIIVALAAILLPLVQRVRNQARAVACQARLHQWSLLFDIHANEKEGTPVTRAFDQIYFWDKPQFLGNGSKSDYPMFDSSLYLCPSATRLERNNVKALADGSMVGGGTTFGASWWQADAGPSGRMIAKSYSTNLVLWSMGITSYDEARKTPGYQQWWNEESWRWSNNRRGFARGSVPALFDSTGILLECPTRAPLKKVLRYCPMPFGVWTPIGLPCVSIAMAAVSITCSSTGPCARWD